MSQELDDLPVAKNGGSREFVDGVYIVQECNPKGPLQEQYTGDPPDWYVPGHEVHMQQNAFVVVGSEKTLLWDTCSPANREGLLSELDDILGDRNLDYVMPSHPEAPHAGNAFTVLERYPDAEFVVPDYETAHELYLMDEATKASPGDQFDLGGHVIEVVDPVFVDHKVHMWARELSTNTLFTVDWLGMVHMDSECLLCADELEQPITTHRRAEFHSRALFWIEYADPGKMATAIDHIVDNLAPDVLAPAHGCPVRENAAEYLLGMNDVVEAISQAGKTTEAW